MLQPRNVSRRICESTSTRTTPSPLPSGRRIRYTLRSRRFSLPLGCAVRTDSEYNNTAFASSSCAGLGTPTCACIQAGTLPANAAQLWNTMPNINANRGKVCRIRSVSVWAADGQCGSNDNLLLVPVAHRLKELAQLVVVRHLQQQQIERYLAPQVQGVVLVFHCQLVRERIIGVGSAAAARQAVNVPASGHLDADVICVLVWKLEIDGLRAHGMRERPVILIAEQGNPDQLPLTRCRCPAGYFQVVFGHQWLVCVAPVGSVGQGDIDAARHRLLELILEKLFAIR